MITAIYAALLACWLVVLSVRVIKMRTARKIWLGSGGDERLHSAIRVQENAAEYIPLALILLLLLELIGGHPALLLSTQREHAAANN